ncbi:30S ribosomal protein S20 [Mycoplasma putrefaciens]|uniref:Small ribosomal subunit protein bS20 n=2 Tax=Mycoplasma putrefaciens TaxID=2123 RepID=M9WH62_9MOLU|nr:30S ribosomal protein S20 [Mycoplasma putrefaciens]AEM68808.1 ribosomal protein S20 [Mycoplasma putrefaciens KS1]AGJ90729.1 30S ribosomal protein S20 [Mycoplasma putrefaciens Mput9231]SYV96102.1 30S ribosomal protein S20 [Mycoplasma putrefaciens]
MANIKSQKKRVLTNEKSRLANRAFKSEIKTAIKKALAAKKTQDASQEQLVKDAVSLVDRGYKKGIFKQNKAAREKSRLMSA